MWQAVVQWLPDILPIPLIAAGMFHTAKGIAAILGVFAAIVLFLRSRSKTYRYLFVKRPFLLAIAGAVVSAIVYGLLFGLIDSPPLIVLFVELLFYAFSYGILIMVLVLSILLAPARLWNFITKNVLHLGGTEENSNNR